MTKDTNSMTTEARRALRELIAGKTHPAPCCCPACLYAEFQKRKRRPGQPIGKYTFFLDWLVWRIGGGSKEPYIRRVREIINSLYEEFEELEILLNDGVVRTYRARFESDRFVKLIEGLQRKRNLDYYQTQPARARIGNTWAALRFTQRVGRFIHAQPGKKITRRELLRHFSNKRTGDFENIRTLLESNFRIRMERRGRSRLFRVGKPMKNITTSDRNPATE